MAFCDQGNAIWAAFLLFSLSAAAGGATSLWETRGWTGPRWLKWPYRAAAVGVLALSVWLQVLAGRILALSGCAAPPELAGACLWMATLIATPLLLDTWRERRADRS